MCGIAGIIGSRASVETRQCHDAASAASRAGRRRAYGARRESSLAHRRLAILDLSEGGHQPMVLGAQVLTYNGEIYNHEAAARRACRARGTRAATRKFCCISWRSAAAPVSSNWSVCLRSPFGTRRARRLLLARDRLGIKPLYYQILPDGIAFASELKALLVLGKPADRPQRGAGLSVPRLRSRTEDDLSRDCEVAGRAYAHVGRTAACSIERYWQPSTAIEARSASDTLHELDDIAARGRTGAHLVGRAGRCFLERRHRFRAHDATISKPRAPTVWGSMRETARNSMPHAARPLICTRCTPK